MSIKDELEELYVAMEEDDATEAFERLGMYDHEGMRMWGMQYGVITAEGRKLSYMDLGAAMVGGIYLGLALAEKWNNKKEE